VMNLAYLAMTILIVGSVVLLAMYFQSPRRSAEVLPLDTPSISSQVVAPEALPVPPAVGAPVSTAAAPTSEVPVVASPAPSLPTAPTRSGDELVLHFRGQSWVDVVDQAGAPIERGLIPAGTERRFAAGRVAHVTLGDATAVDVDLGSVALDLVPYSEANVARFTVSSEGKVYPVAAN